MTKVKICGITTLEDIEYVNEFKPDFAGFVMFYPKSRRNIDSDKALTLRSLLDSSVKSVAVMVQPSIEQIKEAKNCRFDYVQIHGDVDDEILINSPLPVLRAFNVSDIERFSSYSRIDNIKGYVFDSQVPGSGKTFDWSLLDKVPRDNKIFILAGGLNPDNVLEAIKKTHPDGVDVSSGVENESGIGKSRDKIKAFMKNARGKESK